MQNPIYDLDLSEPDDYEQDPPELALTDRAGADRHVAAIARLEAEYELEKQGAQETIERLQRWIAARCEAITEQTNWHRSVLRRYHEAVLSIDPKLKTIKLPHGELQSRAQQPAWEFDATVFLPWAAENLPSTVRPPKPGEPSVDVAAAKRLLTVLDGKVISPAGEIVDGVTVTDRAPKLSVVIAEDPS